MNTIAYNIYNNEELLDKFIVARAKDYLGVWGNNNLLKLKVKEIQNFGDKEVYIFKDDSKLNCVGGIYFSLEK